MEGSMVGVTTTCAGACRFFSNAAALAVAALSLSAFSALIASFAALLSSAAILCFSAHAFFLLASAAAFLFAAALFPSAAAFSAAFPFATPASHLVCAVSRITGVIGVPPVA
jgi:hypothetical protein